jgi:cytosine permease
MSESTPQKPVLAIVKKPWQNGLGPYYVGLFLWVVFFDQLGMRALPIAGVGWSFLGALVAGPLCFLLLYRVPALWGHATGKTIVALGTSTFGQAGSRWIPGLLLGLAQIVWFAVAIHYGTDLCLKGLVAGRFIDTRLLQRITVGGLSLQGPFVLAVSLFWSLAAGLAGRFLMRVIAAIMYIYPIFPAMVFGIVMMIMIGGVRTFAPTGIDPLTNLTLPQSRVGFFAMMLVIQMIFGFFAMAGAASADWGGATSSESDVRKGGWIVVALAPVVIASISFVTVAGYYGRVRPVAGASSDNPYEEAMAGKAGLDGKFKRNLPSTSTVTTIDRRPIEASFRAALSDGVGGNMACAMLMIVGVAALAPAVYSSSGFGHRLHGCFPNLSRTQWTIIATLTSWPLVATGVVDRLELVFTIMGALFAPLVASMAAEYRIHKTIWPGPRKGVNWPGIAGWLSGLLVGLTPFLIKPPASFQPAAFWAFLVGFAVYTVVAKLAGEAKLVDAAPLVESQLTTEPIPPPSAGSIG